MVGVAKGLTHWTVTPALVGSNPITHPIYKLKLLLEINSIKLIILIIVGA